MKKCNKLIIKKLLSKGVDKDNLFTYKLEWIFNEDIILIECKKLDSNEFFEPIENFTIEELISHKKHCCMEIDDIEIQEIII